MSSTGIKGMSLYRNILRAHARYLPHEMKQLGDAYVKAEVRKFLFSFPSAAIIFIILLNHRLTSKNM